MATSTATSPSSLCFLDAFLAKHEGRISEQEYFGHLTAHLRGIRHQDDDLADQRVQERIHYWSIFTAVFRIFALSSSSTLSATDTAIYDQLLHECSSGDYEAIKSSFAKLENNQSLPIPLQALAVLAARQAHADILDFFLLKGAEFDEDIVMSARQATLNAKMMELLWNRNWQDIQHSERIQEDMVLRAINLSSGMLEFLIQKGVKIPDSLFILPNLGEASPGIIKALVRERGIGLFKGTAVLTLAIRAGNREVVEYLCQQGLPLNDVPPELDPRESGLCSPLYTAVQERNFGILKLLLEHGADPHAPYIGHHRNSVINRVRELDDKEILTVLEKYASQKPLSQKI